MTEQNGLERSSATDKLRRLLDERGVEYYDGTNGTLWGKDASGYRFSADELTSGRMSVHMWCETPEQAVAATLGPGTCEPVISDNLTESEGTGDAWADCSACGHLLFVLTDPNSQPPNYCPNCGARVIGGADAD